MRVISLQEYRRAKRIQEVSEKQEHVESKREIYKRAYKAKLLKRLQEKGILPKLSEKQSKPPTKK
jgi:hypothetical protein